VQELHPRKESRLKVSQATFKLLRDHPTLNYGDTQAVIGALLQAIANNRQIETDFLFLIEKEKKK
jgi:hypothetical protein